VIIATFISPIPSADANKLLMLLFSVLVLLPAAAGVIPREAL
jgi:hypothetical protein